jgi:hypothetical protein
MRTQVACYSTSLSDLNERIREWLRRTHGLLKW